MRIFGTVVNAENARSSLGKTAGLHKTEISLVKQRMSGLCFLSLEDNLMAPLENLDIPIFVEASKQSQRIPTASRDRQE
jgi:hypothetical protein